MIYLWQSIAKLLRQKGVAHYGDRQFQMLNTSKMSDPRTKRTDLRAQSQDFSRLCSGGNRPLVFLAELCRARNKGRI